MKRIRHYLSRLASLDLRNMIAVAQKVAAERRRPRAIILLDMVWCSLVYQAGYLDYQEFEFSALRRQERKTWITSGTANSIVLKYNQRQFRSQFSDKARFNTVFDPWLGRDWIDVREADTEELRRFLAGRDTVMAKAVSGMSGAGIQRIDVAGIGDIAGFHARLIADGQYLIESYITQHPDMAALNPESVNSLRVISFLDGSDVHVLETVLRMGNGADVDNYGRGGMYTVLDEKTGVAHFGAFDRFAHTFTSHPLTGTPIVGFQVPRYPEVLTLVDTISRVVPEIPYVGWDIAIGDRGPLVIEGNYNTGVFQMKPSLSGVTTGLLRKFRSVIDF